jgi:hypothetical protein
MILRTTECRGIEDESGLERRWYTLIMTVDSLVTEASQRAATNWRLAIKGLLHDSLKSAGLHMDEGRIKMFGLLVGVVQRGTLSVADI